MDRQRHATHKNHPIIKIPKIIIKLNDGFVFGTAAFLVDTRPAKNPYTAASLVDRDDAFDNKGASLDIMTQVFIIIWDTKFGNL